MAHEVDESQARKAEVDVENGNPVRGDSYDSCKAEDCIEEPSVEVYWIDPDSGAEFGWTPVCKSHAREVGQPTRPLEEDE